MSASFTLVVLPTEVVLAPENLQELGDEMYLVHTQSNVRNDAHWSFVAHKSLSQPEALRRAQEWQDSARHPDWPGFF